MKKVSIISILIIFIAAIFVVGFLGMDLVVYNPVVYVTGIEWNAKEFENKANFKVEQYETKNDEGYNAKLKYETKNELDPNGITVNIKCHTVPLNASNTDLNYFIDVENHLGVSYEKLSDQSCNVTFKEFDSFSLFVTSDDAKEFEYVIFFDIWQNVFDEL